VFSLYKLLWYQLCITVTLFCNIPQMTNDPTAVLNGGGQMPVGGAEETSIVFIFLIQLLGTDEDPG
jgi:hypothetical protein